MIGTENMSAGLWNRLVEAIQRWQRKRREKPGEVPETPIRVPTGLEKYMQNRGGYKNGEPDPDWMIKEILRISRTPAEKREPAENKALPNLRNYFMENYPERLEEILGE